MVTSLPPAVAATATLVALSTLPAGDADTPTEAAVEAPAATTRTPTSSVLSMLPYTTPWRASRSIP
jgi:hypothetical protein